MHLSQNKTYLTEIVGASWIHDIHENDHPVVEKSSVASEEAVNWNLSTSERLHDQQMVQLVVGLCQRVVGDLVVQS